MRTRKIVSQTDPHVGYGAGSGDTEYYEYECPCGKGRIIEEHDNIPGFREHDNIPGFREHDVYLMCDQCKQKYRLDTSKGVRCWDLVEI